LGHTECLEAHQWQVTLPEFPNSALSNLKITLVAKHLVENIKNPAFTAASHFSALAAKHLDENIKILAFKNPSFTGASHFAGIPKSSIATLPHLHWQQNTLVKIPKIWHSQIFARITKSALPNCQTDTGGRTHRGRGKTHCQNY